ncbi:MAG: TIGR01458 family HAD-type hydrolase [Thermoleophilaceae bacterium]|nr:TIGR01458 family HAD-type hydrolase [Thermoleophilaceae bacterium]
MPAPAVRAVLLDLDGVLYVGEQPLPGAVAAVERLRSDGYILRFVTNTTVRSRAATLEKLRRIGIAVDDRELVTPAGLAVRHCRERGHERVALVMNEEVKRDFEQLEAVGRRADAVIVGDLGDAFSYEVLNDAFRLLMDGAELVALQKNRYWLTEDGLSLDVGAFVAALEYASGRRAYVVGKPAPAFFEQSLEDAGVPASEAAMVGDDVETDVGGAMSAGLSGYLVRTGKFREDALNASHVLPTAVLASITDLPAALRGG